MFKKLILSLLCSTSLVQCMDPITLPGADLSVKFWGKYRGPETMLAINPSLLNNCNYWDRLWWARHILDGSMGIKYGAMTYGAPILEFVLGIRNKARWGDPTSIATTTPAVTRVLDDVGGPHSHSFPRLVSWVREMWIEFDLARSVGLHFPTTPRLKLGAFPFALGRGIALGTAYAVGPELLGFYTDAAIDQYAFGAKMSDTFIKDVLDFDFYVALLQCRSGSLTQTGAVIYAQEIGRRENPERGPYSVNFLAATRFLWTVFENPIFGTLTFEPYGLYNHDPEQRVEFFADATSKLGTLGLAVEYERSGWEFGFDYAINLGRQLVKAWDRNFNQLENRNGSAVIVNSHAYANIDPESIAQTSMNDMTKFKAINARNTIAPNLSIQKYGQQVQNLIDAAVEGEQFDGLKLGTVPDYSDAVHAPVPVSAPNVLDNTNKDSIFNAPNRFRNEYTNLYEGWMIVGDAAVWLIDKELRIAATGGIASGDANPNDVNKDGKYAGFIPLQEVYVGKRVQSVFLLGSGGQLSRPLSTPRGPYPPNRFASTVNGFTNLILAGGGLLWNPAASGDRKVSVNPNVIAFWQQYPGFKFDATAGKDTSEYASSYLGLELNLFFEYMMFKNTRFFLVSSLFIPGQHFTDIKGRPLNPAQEARLNQYNRTSITGGVPNIGDDMAISFNLGMEVKF